MQKPHTSILSLMALHLRLWGELQGDCLIYACNSHMFDRPPGKFAEPFDKKLASDLNGMGQSKSNIHRDAGLRSIVAPDWSGLPCIGKTLFSANKLLDAEKLHNPPSQ